MINYLVVDKKYPEQSQFVTASQVRSILALRDLGNIEVFVGIDGQPSRSLLVDKSAETTKQDFITRILATKKYLEFGNTLWR